MNRFKVISWSILLVSFLNLGWTLTRAFHTDLFPPETFPERHASIQRAKQILEGMGLSRAGYIPEGDFLESAYDYYDVQSAIAPIMLGTGSEESMVLVHARNSHHIDTVPGFVLVEDLGNDLALFRKR
jgi:hypothetical protein